jgi:hypothetical protein
LEFWIFSKGTFSLFVQALNGMLSSPHDFKAINNMPNVFIASTMDVEDFFGNPKYEINAFIVQYYVSYCEKQIQEVTFYFWRRKDDENIK